MFFLLAAVALAETCTDPVSVEMLVTELEAAERAWVEMDEAGLEDQFSVLSAYTLPCVDVPLPPRVAARYHRLGGVVALVRGQEDEARSWMQAAKRASPDEPVDTSVIVPGTPVDHLWQSVSTEVRVDRVPAAKEGALYFDGVSSRLRPRLPVIVQVMDDQTAEQTLLLQPGEPLPDYDAVPHLRNGLWTGAAVAGGAAVATFVASAVLRGSVRQGLDDPSTTGDAIRSRQVMTNSTVIGSGVLAVGALSVGAAGLAVGGR